MLEERMQELKKKLMEYSSLVEDILNEVIHGLLKKDGRMLRDVINNREPLANSYETDIDEMCVQIIAQYQPTAVNLRTILMIMKMNNDLERMADHAVNISESGLYLIERPLVKPMIDLPRMAEVTAGMMKDAIGSFVNEDAELAQDVCMRDTTVDNFMDQIMRELITFMISDPQTIERALHLSRIAHNLERIADLSTNIGEDVIFIVKGRVIKHHKDGTDYHI